MSPAGLRSTRHRRDERGSAAAELVVLAVVFFVFVAVVVFAGRVNVGTAHVEAAARSAARTISIAREPSAVVAAAEAEAARIANRGSAICTSMGFTPSIGESTVTVTVSCVVNLSEAVLAGVPGSMTVTADATEVIDRYRERAP